MGNLFLAGFSEGLMTVLFVHVIIVNTHCGLGCIYSLGFSKKYVSNCLQLLSSVCKYFGRLFQTVGVATAATWKFVDYSTFPSCRAQ